MEPPLNREVDEPIRYPEWQKPLLEALLELDEEKLRERVAAAEAAISRRLELIAKNSEQQTEHQAIEDALSSLRMLKRISAPPSGDGRDQRGDGENGSI